MHAHLAKFRGLMPSLAVLFSIADGCMDAVRLHAARRGLVCIPRESCEQNLLLAYKPREGGRYHIVAKACSWVDAGGGSLRVARRSPEWLERTDQPRRSASRVETPRRESLGATRQERRRIGSTLGRVHHQLLPEGGSDSCSRLIDGVVGPPEEAKI